MTVLESALVTVLKTALVFGTVSVPPGPYARRFLSAPGTRMAMWPA